MIAGCTSMPDSSSPHTDDDTSYGKKRRCYTTLSSLSLNVVHTAVCIFTLTAFLHGAHTQTQSPALQNNMAHSAGKNKLLQVRNTRHLQNEVGLRMKHPGFLHEEFVLELLNVESALPPRNRTGWQKLLRRFSPSNHSKAHYKSQFGDSGGVISNHSLSQRHHMVDTSMLWQTYKTADGVPEEAARAESSWKKLNPELQLSFYDDRRARDFVAATFSKEVLDMYEAFPLSVMRADFWRYAVLYAKGGVYADFDTECDAPFSSWLPPVDGGAEGLPLESQYKSTQWSHCPILIGLENNEHFCQWAIASVPGHPLLLHVIKVILDRSKNGINTTNEHFVHEHTGPAVWTHVIRHYLGLMNMTKSGDIFNHVYTDQQSFEKMRKLGVCLFGKTFYNGVNAKNLCGSRAFSGWASWIQERKDLMQNITQRLRQP